MKMTRYQQNLHIGDGGRVYSYNTHVATINSAARELLIHGWWSVTTSKHINYVAKEYGLTKKDAPKEESQEKTPLAEMLKSVAMVCAFGNILCDTEKDKNDWKKRMIATLPGIDMPEDFDKLPEEERTRRLDGALHQIA